MRDDRKGFAVSKDGALVELDIETGTRQAQGLPCAPRLADGQATVILVHMTGSQVLRHKFCIHELLWFAPAART
jgi:hypothetical protein